jgi:hypothetical protein
MGARQHVLQTHALEDSRTKMPKGVARVQAEDAPHNRVEPHPDDILLEQCGPQRHNAAEPQTMQAFEHMQPEAHRKAGRQTRQTLVHTQPEAHRKAERQTRQNLEHTQPEVHRKPPTADGLLGIASHAR